MWARIRKAPQWVSKELGMHTLLHASRDVHIVILMRTLRTFCFGIVGLIFALYFNALGVSDQRIGLFMTLTQLGDVLLSLVLTFIADALGRRRTLLLGALLMVLAGAVFANFDNYWIPLAAAIVGVISPSGNEIGPFRAIEESTLAHLVTEPEERPEIFAWYIVSATASGAAGLFAAGWLVEKLKHLDGWTEVDAFRTMFWIYGAFGILKAFLSLFLTKDCELHSPHPSKPASETSSISERAPLLSTQNGNAANGTSESRVQENDTTSSKTPFKSTFSLSQISRTTLPLLFKLCLLFSIDSLASGVMPWSFINYYLDRKFAIPKSTLGSLMATAWLCSAFGNIFAAALAKRIGLIQTMVFTHVPASLFLALLPVGHSLPLTIVLLCARASLNSMDQAPRSAFLAMVVKPEERTAVMGIVNVVKTLSQSGGPSITGALAGSERFWVAFVVAGALKGVYDVGLVALFWGKVGNAKVEDEDGESNSVDGDGEGIDGDARRIIDGGTDENGTSLNARGTETIVR